MSLILPLPSSCEEATRQTASFLALVGTLVHRERFFKARFTLCDARALGFPYHQGGDLGVFSTTLSAPLQYGLCTRLIDEWCYKYLQATLLYIPKRLVDAARVLGSVVSFKS